MAKHTVRIKCKKCDKSGDYVPPEPDFVCICHNCGAIVWKPTPKQRKFIQSYAGNATEAARKAGYSEKSIYVLGKEALENPKVSAAIAARETGDFSAESRVFSRQERMAFWTRMMQHGETEQSRLKASELLGKANGDFLNRVDMTGGMDVNVRRKSDDELIDMLCGLVGGSGNEAE